MSVFIDQIPCVPYLPANIEIHLTIQLKVDTLMVSNFAFSFSSLFFSMRLCTYTCAILSRSSVGGVHLKTDSYMFKIISRMISLVWLRKESIYYSTLKEGWGQVWIQGWFIPGVHPAYTGSFRSASSAGVIFKHNSVQKNERRLSFSQVSLINHNPSPESLC